MKKLWLTALWVLLASAPVFAADGPKEVEAAIQQGNYTLAEQELRQVIVEHPQSAKAHYLLAQVLAHEGNIGDAQKEANQAKAIDPKISFTNPARFERFQAELNQALAPPTRGRSGAATVPMTRAAPDTAVEQPAAPESNSRGSIWPWVIGAVIVVLLFGWFRRRQQSVMNNPGYGNQGYGPQGYGAPGPQNPYGNGPYPPPGYQPGPQGGSGIVGSVLGGLAGGALGAAAVNAYENHERREEEARGDYGYGNGNDSGANFAPSNPQDQAYDDLRNQPIDMGNDDNSWDDGSGGGGDSFGGDDDSWN